MRSKFVKRHLIKVNFGCYGVLKIKFQHIQKQPLEVLFFFKPANFLNRLQRRCFSVKFAIFLRIIILNNICERLLLHICHTTLLSLSLTFNSNLSIEKNFKLELKFDDDDNLYCGMANQRKNFYMPPS